MTRRLRAARLTVAVAMAAAGLAFAAAPALASSTPNEQETVTCGMGCFNVSTNASITNGNATFSSTGDVITEAFTINDGNPTGDLEFDATIDGTELTASQIGCTDSSATAYPGPSPVTVSSSSFPVTCTVTYSPSATDVQNGYVDTDFTVSSMSDTATTTGEYAFYETGHVPAVSMSHQVATISGPAAASGTEYAAAGESIDYSTTVTNTGQAPVDAASVTDSNPAIDYSCPSQTLNANQSENCTASYTVTQNDVDGGPVDSSATAGVTPTGSQVPVFTGTDDLSLNPSQQPAAALTQTPQVSGFTAASRPITYNENVTNTGNVTLFDPSISNTLAGLLPLRCAQSVLAPGASTTCTQTYITSAGDVAAGSVANTATMTLGTPNSTVSSNPSGSTVPFTGPAAVPPSIYTPPAPVKAPKKPSLTTTASNGDTHLVAQPIGGLTRGKPSVRFAVSVSRHSAKLQQLTVTLPSGLRVLSHRVHGRTVVRGVSVKGAKVRSVALSHGRLVITLRTATSSATISLGSSTLGETRALHTQAQHKKLRSLRFKVAARDTRHHSRTVTVTVRHFLS